MVEKILLWKEKSISCNTYITNHTKIKAPITKAVVAAPAPIPNKVADDPSPFSDGPGPDWPPSDWLEPDSSGPDSSKSGS